MSEDRVSGAGGEPSGHDRELMARALELAANGIYTTRPNPTVGCVLVRDGRIVGEGWTAPAGGPHAEVAALAVAGGRARGATAYVTLEPCSHTGRTGPCSVALIEAGVARVVCTMLDPNPLVAGRGVAGLEAAGIEVHVGLLEKEAAELNRGYLARMSRGRPWIRSKLAASLDGRTALADGASKWLTGTDARRDVQRWRARSGVVMTGIGTLLADDPALTARPDEPELATLQPARVVVDSRLRTPAAAKTLRLPGDVLIFTTREPPYDAALLRRGAPSDGARVAIEHVPGGERCDLAAVLERLAAREVNDVLVEAGPGLNGALLAAGLIDELVVYLAPKVLGDGARGMFAIPPLASLADAIELAIDDVTRVGSDLRILARPSPRPGGAR